MKYMNLKWLNVRVHKNIVYVNAEIFVKNLLKYSHYSEHLI